MNLRQLEQEKVKIVQQEEKEAKLLAYKLLTEQGFTPLTENTLIFESVGLGFKVVVNLGEVCKIEYDYKDKETLEWIAEDGMEDTESIVGLNDVVNQAVELVKDFINGNYPEESCLSCVS